MILNANRILMSEADAGGNSAAAAPAAAVDVSQAQGTPPVIGKEVADAIASAVTSAIAGVKDSIFAEARRTFTAPNKAKAKTDEVPAPAASAQPDPIKLRKLDRAITTAGLKPTDLAYELAEKAWMDSGDESDPVGWTKGFFDRLGIGTQVASQPTTAAPAAAVNTATQRTAAPVSDRGAPPVSAVALEEQNLLAMSPSDREALRRQKGDKWFTDKVLEQSRGATYKLR